MRTPYVFFVTMSVCAWGFFLLIPAAPSSAQVFRGCCRITGEVMRIDECAALEKELGYPPGANTYDDTIQEPGACMGARIDTDNDGVPDNEDPDDDNDGVFDDEEKKAGTFPVVNEGAGDMDSDGVPDYRDGDLDGDGDINEVERQVGSDYRDPTSNLADYDGDGVLNSVDSCPRAKNIGDQDGDHIDDACDNCPGVPN